MIVDFIKRKEEYIDRKFLCPLVFEINGSYSDSKGKLFPNVTNNLCPVLNLNKINIASFRVGHFSFTAGAKDIHRTTLSSLSHQDISFICSFTRSFSKYPYLSIGGRNTKKTEPCKLLSTTNHSKVKFDLPNKVIMINRELYDIYYKHKAGQGRPKELLESCISERDELISFLDEVEHIDDKEICARISKYIMSEYSEVDTNTIDEIILAILYESSISLLFDIEQREKSDLILLIKDEIKLAQPIKKRKI